MVTLQSNCFSNCFTICVSMYALQIKRFSLFGSAATQYPSHRQRPRDHRIPSIKSAREPTLRIPAKLGWAQHKVRRHFGRVTEGFLSLLRLHWDHEPEPRVAQA